MIGLGLRLVVRGGREATARLAFIGAGVALGVAMLLFAFAGIGALHAQDARWGWITTSAHNRHPSVAEASSDPLLWHRIQDQFAGQTIQRIDLAPTGSRSPVPPGIKALPGPGQFYASPALTHLLDSTRADQLADRFPGRLVGTIDDNALPSPNALIIVIGHTPAQLAGQPGAFLVRSIETAPRQHSYSTFQEVALGVGAAGLLFPVLIFVGMATRIAAAGRQQRLAAMRLVGANPGQVAVLAAIEAGVAATAGTLAGIGMFWLAKPLLARIPLTGDVWFSADLHPGAIAVIAVSIAVPTGAAIAALAALRRVRISPLGVTRRVTPPPPQATRLIPLGLGLLILSLFALAGHPYDRGAASTYAPTATAGFVLVMAGIVTAGPWLTMNGARLLALRSRHPATLIASRRLGDDPNAAFRAVSGLILAVFVGSVLIGVTTTASSPTSLASTTDNKTAETRPATTTIDTRTATQVTLKLRGQDGVRGVAIIYQDPTGNVNGFPAGLVSCQDLTTTPAIGRCAPDTNTAVMPLYALDAGHTQPRTTWPAAQPAPAHLETLPVQAIIAATDGSAAALERVGTVVESTAPTGLTVPQTLGQLSAASRRDVNQLQHMASIALLISLLIAGCSLAVATAGGLIERRRPFSLLRLTGVPLRVLRHVIILETAIPLISLAVVSAAGGLLTATLLLRAVRGATLRMPGPEYYLTVLAGLSVAIGLVILTMPLLHRISQPETARNG